MLKLTRLWPWIGRHERQDLQFLAIGIWVIPLTWYAFLGLRPGQATAGADAVPMLLNYLTQLAQQGGDWTETIYRPDLQGGVKVHDTFGATPIFQLLGALGFKALAILNLTIYFFQLCIAFLGARIATNLATLWNERNEAAMSWPTGIALIWALAFAPILGWKLGFGHMTLIQGSFTWVAMLALVLASRLNRLSITLVVVAFLAMIHGIPSVGHQSLIYSIIFGLPISLGMIWPARGAPESWSTLPKTLLLPTLILLAAIGVSMPKFWGMVAHATGGDSTRSMGNENIIFSYVTATARDWLSSIPWGMELISNGREKSLFHEINYPFGPFLTLLVIYPWKRYRALGIGVCLSFLLALLFSMDFTPVSSGLASLLPILKGFRVPERAMLPFSLFLPIVGAAILLKSFSPPSVGQNLTSASKGIRAKKKPTRKSTAAALGVGALFVGMIIIPLDPLFREVLTWTTCLGAIFAVMFSEVRSKWITPVLLLSILGGASVAGFKERISLPYRPHADQLAEIRKIGEAAIQAEPRLASPLTRAQLVSEASGFGPNLPFLMGFSTLDGYWFPQRRFVQLVYGLEREKFNSTANTFVFPVSSAVFKTLKQLYNVAFQVSISKTGQPEISSLGLTAGQAWISAKLTAIVSFEALTERLRAAGDHLSLQALQETWVVSTEPKVKAALADITTGSSCAGSQVLEVKAPRGGQSVELKTQSAAPNCPLTVAMNYAENMKAYALKDGQPGTELRVFPSYGALAGVLIPQGTHDLLVRVESVDPLWTQILFYLGILLFIGVLASVWRSSNSTESGSTT